MQAIRVGIDAVGAHGWRVSVGAPGGASERRVVSAEQVEQIRAETAALWARRPAPVFVHEPDAAWDRSEERAGRVFREALLGAGPAASLFDRLWALAGRAPVVVLFDVSGEAAAVPWELMTDAAGVPLEAGPGRLVVRAAAGEPSVSRAEAGGLRVLRWVSDPSDPHTLGRHAAALDRVFAGLDVVSVQDAAPGELIGRPEPGALDALHIVAHGMGSAEGFVLGVSQGQRSAGGAAHSLAPLLRDAAFTVLDVCGGAETPEDELQGLATRLVRAGTPVCVGPARRCAAKAAQQLAEGLYPALAAGQSLLEALAAGRRRVQAAGVPHPHHRWFHFQVHVSDLAALGVRLEAGGGEALPAWLVEGVASPERSVRALWEAARSIARQEQDGFVGLEHLLLAGAQGPGPVGRAVRRVFDLPARRSRLRERLSGLSAWSERAADEQGTPWLREVLGPVSARQGEEALWEAIVGAWHPGWTFLTGVDLPRTLLFHASGGDFTTDRGAPVVEQGAAAVDLAVVGGPEDGRRLGLVHGETIGRAGGGAEKLLYAETSVVDAGVSRSHLVWQGGAVRGVQPAWLHRLGGERVGLWGEAVVVRVGEVVELGRGTVVRGVGPNDRAAHTILPLAT